MFKWLKTLFQPEPESTVGIEKPKITPKIQEPKKESVKEPAINKPGRKKKGITKTDLNKMTKDELEAYARKEHKVDLDKRKKKADLVEEVLKLAK